MSAVRRTKRGVPPISETSCPQCSRSLDEHSVEQLWECLRATVEAQNARLGPVQ